MWDRDILQDMQNIDGLVWLGCLTHFSDDISAPRTRIISSIASLKPCYKAGRFEYNKAYI